MEHSGNRRLPQSVRLNNPGNIRQSRQCFSGEINHGRQSAFKEFVSVKYGFRAMKRVLKTYLYNHGLDTIEKIITRWAPPQDHNDTEAYIRFVSEQSKIPRNRKLRYTPADIVPLMLAIARFEAGYLPDGWIHASFEAWEMK